MQETAKVGLLAISTSELRGVFQMPNIAIKLAMNDAVQTGRSAVMQELYKGLPTLEAQTKNPSGRNLGGLNLERETRLELATSTLARLRSTN